MYKYEILGNQIIEYLKQQKKEGNNTFVLRATEVNRLFNIGGQRYPMICQAMEYAAKRFQGTQIDGKNPSSSLTVEYKLSLFGPIKQRISCAFRNLIIPYRTSRG